MAKEPAQKAGATEPAGASVPKPGQRPKKKKRNAPDPPQPARLSPPDGENPVLNPRPKTGEEEKQACGERMAAINFIKYESVGSPVKAQPPPQLLALIAAFMAAYGFNNTGGVFSLERNVKAKTLGWDDEIGKKLPKGMPDLVRIYADFIKERREAKELEHGDYTGSSSSGSGEDSKEGDDGDEEPKTKKAQRTRKTKKVKKPKSSSGSSSSRTSDSDADDGNGLETSKPPAAKVLAAANGLVNKLKRKRDGGSSSSSGSGSDSSSSGEEPAQKRAKLSRAVNNPRVKTASPSGAKAVERGGARETAKPTINEGTETPSESSSEESASSVEEETPNGVTKKPPADQRNSSTDSSRTMKGSSPRKAISANPAPSSSDSSSSSSPPSDSGNGTAAANIPAPAPENTKHNRSASPRAPAKASKAPNKANTPFSRIPQDVKVDPKFASNAYVPYDYAERAHQDLSVAKGKGFTKEKNKKKRGS
jgi:hypothetical protein